MPTEDDRHSPAPRTQDDTTLVAGLLVGALVLLALLGGGAAILFWLWAPPPVVAPAPAPAKTVYDREELKRSLERKSEREVIDLLGRPDHTGESGGRTTWTYHDRTIDPATGKIDAAAAVWIADGRVVGFGF